jgi:hypothetical protein
LDHLGPFRTEGTFRGQGPSRVSKARDAARSGGRGPFCYSPAPTHWVMRPGIPIGRARRRNGGEGTASGGAER